MQPFRQHQPEHTGHDGTTVIEFNRSGTIRPYEVFAPELGAAFQRDGKLWTRLSRALFWPKNPRFLAAKGYDPPYDSVVACVGGSYVREG